MNYGNRHYLQNRRYRIAYGKSDKDEIATYVTIAGLILVLIMVLDMLGGLFDTLKSILNLY